MKPVLWQWHFIKIHTYGVFLALSLLAAWALLGWRLRKEARGAVLLAGLGTSFLAGIAGSRILYVIQYWDYYRKIPFEIIRIDSGGMSWYGGLAAGFLAALIYYKRKGISLLWAADELAPGIALGQSIGRIGCFFNGCCAGLLGAWPLQLAESAGSLGVALILLAARRFRRFEGQAAALYLILQGIVRGVLESFRYDRYVVAGSWALPQVISAVLVVAGVCLGIAVSRQRKINEN